MSAIRTMPGRLAILSLLLLAVAGSPASGATGPWPPTDNQAPPYLGVWEGQAGAKPGLDAHGLWLNRRAFWATTTPYWGDNRWIGIEAWIGGLFMEKFWTSWAAEVPGRRTVFFITMLPREQNPTLEGGAKGEYNSHFTLMAQNLVKVGLGNSVICLGPVNEGEWKAANSADAANFVAYWQQIVKTMRAVPGAEKLQFDWVGTTGKTDYPVSEAYPGDDYVDFVGMVLFDRCFDKAIYPIPEGSTDAEIESRHKKAWEQYYLPAAQNGLEAWQAVADAHHKPFSIPAWCLYSDHYEDGTVRTGGDNPYFIQQMFDYVQNPAHNVYFATYFDNDFDCDKLTPVKGQPVWYPKSSALYQQLFSLPSAAGSTTPGSALAPTK